MRVDNYCYGVSKKPDHKVALIIHTGDTNTESWAIAARAVLSFCQPIAAGLIAGELHVEIRNLEKMYWDNSGPLPNDPILLGALSQLREDILNNVCTFMDGAWSSIAYHMRFRRDSEDYSKPTIIVFCHPNSSCDFKKAEDRIVEVLDTTSTDIYLEFLPGEITNQGRDGEKFRLDITEKPLNGGSIGIEGNEEEAGTLGGWVTLNLPERRVPCALTCYRVVRSVKDDAATDHTDRHGVVPDDDRGHVMVEYPAACDRRETKTQLDYVNRVQPNRPDITTQYQLLSSRILNPRIGTVILASGFKVKENTRLDRALIESPETYSPNRMLPYSSIPRAMWPPPEYYFNAKDTLQKFTQPTPGEWVVKVGRKTGTTGGEINRMQRHVKWPSGIITREFEIMSEGSFFVNPCYWVDGFQCEG